MKKIKKTSIVIVFMLTFLFTIQALSQEDLQLFKSVDDGQIQYFEIITPKSTSKVVVEAFGKEGQLIQFFNLEQPVKQVRQSGNEGHFFYITKSMASLNEIDILHINPRREDEKQIIVSEMAIKEILEEDNQTLIGKEMESREATAMNLLDENQEQSLKVMSYNIHAGRDLFGRYSLDRIAEVMKESGAEIIGVQEVDQHFVRTKFQDQIKYLSETLSMYYAYGPNLNIAGGKYGNAVLSVHPIESFENLKIPSGREQRGLLKATIDVNGQLVDFYVTHLGLNQKERMDQVTVIEQQIDRAQNPVILVGDFNARPNSREISRLSRRLLDVGERMGYNRVPTFDLPVLSGRIDYILWISKWISLIMKSLKVEPLIIIQSPLRSYCHKGEGYLRKPYGY